MHAEAGAHNGHTVYIRMGTYDEEYDRFLCTAQSRSAAWFVADALNQDSPS